MKAKTSPPMALAPAIGPPRPPETKQIVEMALAHTIGNKVEAAYRRGDLSKSATADGRLGRRRWARTAGGEACPRRTKCASNPLRLISSGCSSHAY